MPPGGSPVCLRCAGHDAGSPASPFQCNLGLRSGTHLVGNSGPGCNGTVTEPAHHLLGFLLSEVRQVGTGTSQLWTFFSRCLACAGISSVSGKDCFILLGPLKSFNDSQHCLNAIIFLFYPVFYCCLYLVVLHCKPS